MNIYQSKIRTTTITAIAHELEKGTILIGSSFKGGDVVYDLVKVTEVIDRNNVRARSLYFWERIIWRVKLLWSKRNNLWEKVKSLVQIKL